MMSFPYSSGDLGEAAAAVDITLDQMFRDYDGSTDDDLFEFVWESCGGGEVDGGAGEMQHAAGVPCCHRLLPGSAPEPPSEDEMAAWLSTIVTGSGGGSDDVRDAVNMAAGDHQDPAVKPDGEPLTEKIDKRLPTRTEERRAKHKARRNPRYAETHGLTEKRRRSKINEKFKMLQQLVPGCDKSSQSSTLDRTVHYMKSLQQQLQAMYPMIVMRSAAEYPVVQPPPLVQPAAVAVGVARPSPVGGLRPPPVPVFPLVTMVMPAAAPPLIYPSSTGDHHLLQGSSSSGSTATSSLHRR